MAYLDTVPCSSDLPPTPLSLRLLLCNKKFFSGLSPLGLFVPGFLKLCPEHRRSWRGFAGRGEKEGTLPGSNPPLVACVSTRLQLAVISQNQDPKGWWW